MTANLPAPTNEPNTLTGCRASTPLWRLLSSNLPADDEVAAILSDPLLHRECKALAPELIEAGKGCGPEAVRRALQPLVLVFGLGSQSESPAFWKVYVQSLEDIPVTALRKAVEEYATLPTSEYFPKPGPLRALALKHAQPIWKAMSRAKRAANSLPRPAIDKGTAEERRAAVERLLRDQA